MLTLGPVGMTSSVGRTAAASCAAIRAGIAQFGELPYQDRMRRPIIGGCVPDLDFRLGRTDRLVAMLASALGDCVGDRTDLLGGQVPVLIGLAEADRPGSPLPDPRRFVGLLEAQVDGRFDTRLSRVECRGHTAGFALLALADELLRRHDVPGCFVCGVDSYLNASTLRWLEDSWRLKHEDYSNGVIPGEAAAAVYVQRRAAPGTAPAMRLKGLGFAREEATVLDDKPQLAHGLTAATRAALAQSELQLHEIDFRLSDANGEAYGFKEHAMVVARLHRAWKPEVPHWHCADSIGDTGAAAGVCQLVVAHQAFDKGYAFGDRAICLTGGNTADRAVAVLERWAAR